MTIRFPAPLQSGDRIGVTSPSSGVGGQHRGRLDFAVTWLEQRGYEVVVGECMDGITHVSAPAADRARELTDLLLDPSIRAVIPPWGGETAIDLVGILDWERIGAAEPTWFVGFSDISTLLTPLTLLTGVATIHGNNLMDTPLPGARTPAVLARHRRACRRRAPSSSRRRGSIEPAPGMTGRLTPTSPSMSTTEPGPGSALTAAGPRWT